jgi:hypothetical protein
MPLFFWQVMTVLMTQSEIKLFPLQRF